MLLVCVFVSFSAILSQYFYSPKFLLKIYTKNRNVTIKLNAHLKINTIFS